jgi:hypothetical protein
MSSSLAIKGGEFLIRSVQPSEVFIPEDFTEEQKMIGQTCLDFIKKEVHPILDQIDYATDTSVMVGLLDKAGELGLLRCRALVCGGVVGPYRNWYLTYRLLWYGGAEATILTQISFWRMESSLLFN